MNTRALLQRLADTLRDARDSVAAELWHERDAFKGYEHCSDISGLEKQLAEIDAALAEFDAMPKEDSDARTMEIVFLEEWLATASYPIGQECCGRGHGDECCGDPDPVFMSRSEILEAMDKRRAELVAAMQSPTPKDRP